MDPLDKLLEEAKNLEVPTEGVPGYTKKPKKKKEKFNPLETMEKTLDAIMDTLNISHDKAVSLVKDYDTKAGVSDMILRAASTKNTPKNAVMDHMIRGFSKAKELFVSTYERRTKMIKKVELMDVVDEREEWITKELGTNDKVIPMDRDALLAYSFPLFAKRSGEISKKYKALQAKSWVDIEMDGEAFEEYLKENVSSTFSAAAFFNTLEDIQEICIMSGTGLSPILQDGVPESSYEAQLAVTWTMELCWKILKVFLVKQRTYIMMFEEFHDLLGENEKTNPFGDNPPVKTWESMQDGMIEGVFEAICRGPLEEKVALT